MTTPDADQPDAVTPSVAEAMPRGGGGALRSSLGERSAHTPWDEPIIIVSYLALRRAVGILGISLPIILFAWGMLDERVWLPTISAYYSLRARDALVGELCTIGCFLFTYRGYDTHDDIVAHAAGACAVLVALVPSTHTGTPHVLHFTFAAALFLLLAYISYFRFTRGNRPTEAKRARNRVYRACAIVMVVAVSLIPVGDLTHLTMHLTAVRPDFLLETLALWAFGLSWLVKGGVLWGDQPVTATELEDERKAQFRRRVNLSAVLRDWRARLRSRNES